MTNAWIKDLRAKLIEQFGGKCQNPHCNSISGLEFHHSAPCGAGRGRGRNQRILEVRRHPELFVLLCWDCHHLGVQVVMEYIDESNQVLKIDSENLS
jgi:hypothetical protein